ncbi:FAD-dependent oxidoreductase [Oerskovia sp. USHLN155]|uniref:FAD-dependent oxidoreductase n=1 Tax=Oerskovia sp. USHLN155 TaxID=3081288 RepID=UPI003015B901
MSTAPQPPSPVPSGRAPSLWEAAAPRDRLPRPALSSSIQADVVIVGGGLTGLATAVELTRHGVRAVVLEALTTGSGTTGRTTGKVSLLQGTRYARIAELHPPAVLRCYAAANAQGMDWLEALSSSARLGWEPRDAVTVALDDQERAEVVREHELSRRLGLDATLDDVPELPFPHRVGLRLAGQAQIDPLQLVDTLLDELDAHDVPVFERSRVLSVRRTGRRSVTVRTDRGQVRASCVVLATGTPLGRRGGFFARLEPLRSYLVSYSVPGPLPEGMYVSAGQNVRSLRTARSPGGDVQLLVGGEGHVVGREQDTVGRLRALDAWTGQWFPGARRTHAWSAQDYRPVAGLPLVGGVAPGDGRVLIATGFDKWGLTNATAAALALTGRIVGRPPGWADVFDPWSSHQARGAARALELNVGVARDLGSQWWQALRPAGNGGSPAEGQGRVTHLGARPTARCTVEGTTHTLSAVCPHLGGVVRWNDAERSWDCGLHGSRFTPDGQVIEGPATRGLRDA